MTGAALHQNLLQPREAAGFLGLVEAWQDEQISITLVGMAGFSNSPTLLNKVRGALGEVLLQSASAATRQRRPCTWSPTCAAEVFFGQKPRLSIGKFESHIPKPFVLSAQTQGANLLIGMKVFGFARWWVGEVAAALVVALRDYVRWKNLAKDNNIFVPASPDILRWKIVSGKPVVLKQVPDEIRVEFMTPLDAERGSPESRPQLLFERLARRQIMLARWQGIKLETDLDVLETDWLSCAYELEFSTAKAVQGGHKFKNKVATDVTFTVRGNLKRLMPLLVLGERTSVGRGASIGLGAYRLVLPD